MPEQTCDYCDLPSKPVRIIRAAKLVTSFTTDTSLPAHNLLIVPTKHVESFAELTAGEAVDMIEEAQRIVRRLGEAALGFDICTHERPLPESGNPQHVSMSVVQVVS